MTRRCPELSGRLFRWFRLTLKAAAVTLALMLLALYVFALPLGLELFFFEDLSDVYSPDYSVTVSLFNLSLKLSLGFIFASCLLVYGLCFILTWLRGGFREGLAGLSHRPAGFYLGRFLFAFPLLSSLTYVVVVAVHLLQESHGIPVGKPPLPDDPLLAFLELSISPLTEEIIFRVLPIGVFLIIRTLTLARRRWALTSWRGHLRFSLLAVVSPDDAKRRLGLRSVGDSGFWRGISSDEWVMILFTSSFFAVSHYFFTSTWDIGKVTSTFIQGLVMGLSYLIYGVQAPILMHWFFNYYLYAYKLGSIVHPSLAILKVLEKGLTLTLGILGLLTLAYFGASRLLERGPFTLRALLISAKAAKRICIRKTGELLVMLRRMDPSDYAAFALGLIVFALRLFIVNYPGPEAGFIFDESYYVKAARRLLLGDPVNNEHPPLTKILIMLGISLFGDAPLGWRVSSIIASSTSVILIYIFASAITGKKNAALCTALLFAADVTAFNIGQAGMLDAPSVTLALAGCIVILKGRYDLSGALFGLAALCKLGSVFISAGIILFMILRSIRREGAKDEAPVRQIYSLGRTISVGLVVFLVGLWIYDVAYGAFNNPLEHLSYIFIYNAGLKYEDPGKVILPLRWINPLDPFSPVAYHVTTVREISASGAIREYHPIAYYGIYSPLWWSIWIVFPLSLLESVLWISRRKGKDAAILVFSWITANFLPYVFLGYIVQRWVYPFYFYMCLPGLYLGAAYYSTRLWGSRVLLGLLMCIQLFWFLVWFPVKPRILIDLLLSLGLPV
jgi:4-amino-4-deoxy-L-arabinose transferase-like glycosyltransferase